MEGQSVKTLIRLLILFDLNAGIILVPTPDQRLCFHHKDSFYAPNFEKVGSILVSACACVRASVRSFFRPSVRSKKNSS